MPAEPLTAREELPRPLAMKRPLAEDFEAWFRESGIDFWPEANAPNELAKIATRRIREAADWYGGRGQIAAEDVLRQMAEELER